ncbi:TOBE domain-containing protein, partial [Inquilinus limosus]
PSGLPEGSAALACIRPQALSLIRPGEGLAGIIVACSLLGEIEQLTIRAEGIPGPLRLRTTGRIQAKPGEAVAVAADPAGVLVFPAE